MPLDATSMRGARLKARFAVNGIHNSSSEGSEAVDGACGASGVVAVDIWICGDVRGLTGVGTIERRCEYAREHLARGGSADERCAGRLGRGAAPARRDSASETESHPVEHVDAYGRAGAGRSGPAGPEQTKIRQ